LNEMIAGIRILRKNDDDKGMNRSLADAVNSRCSRRTVVDTCISSSQSGGTAGEADLIEKVVFAVCA